MAVLCRRTTFSVTGRRALEAGLSMGTASARLSANYTDTYELVSSHLPISS